jgi:hypothetical protein
MNRRKSSAPPAVDLCRANSAFGSGVRSRVRLVLGMATTIIAGM